MFWSTKNVFQSHLQRFFQEFCSKVIPRVVFKKFFPELFSRVITRFPKELFEQGHLNVIAQVLLQLVEITMSMFHGCRSRICCADWCCGSQNCVKGCEEFDMRSNKETRSQFSC